MKKEEVIDWLMIMKANLNSFPPEVSGVRKIEALAEAIRLLKNEQSKEPSSSEKPNKSIEEKCPCYHCEYFEIKGWSHCKIHEDAYGDSRCNDYHKVSQDLTKVKQDLTKVKQDSNKSEIPTSSDDCISRQDVLSEIIRFSTEEGASVECQQLYCDVNNMSPVTLIRPKGHWREVDTNMYACSKCSHVLTIDPLDNSILGMNTCPFCSAEMEGVVDDKGRSKTLVRNRTENVGR